MTCTTLQSVTAATAKLAAGCLISTSKLQADPELEAIRQRRMAELMARQGGGTAGVPQSAEEVG